MLSNSRLLLGQIWEKDCRLFKFYSVTPVAFRDKSVIYNASKRPDPLLTKDFREKLGQGYRHPRSIPIVEPSEHFSKSVSKVFDKVLINQREQIQSYIAAGIKLQKFLKHRQVPLEKSEINARKKRIEEILKREFSVDHIDTENLSDNALRKKLRSLEYSHQCKWNPIEFDDVGSLTYLLSRSASEFACLTNIFGQIKEKNPSYQPRTLFDCGSGVATGLWAAQHTFGKFSEAFLVDPSKHMNDLARLIIGEGDGNNIPTGVSFRLHCPSSVNLKYDLVLCSNTMLELPNAHERLGMLHNLWERVEEDGYLVLAEVGTNAGFHIIAEARDYINQLISLSEEGQTSAHIVAPCPHDGGCPRHSQDTIPCNFPVRYRNFDFLGIKDDQPLSEIISYVVFKKSCREGNSTPRLVEPVLKTKGTLYCRLCTKFGTLQEVLVRKKDDNELYQLSKRMKWGDELPVDLQWVERPKIGTPWMKHQKVKNN